MFLKLGIFELYQITIHSITTLEDKIYIFWHVVVIKDIYANNKSII